VQLKTKYELNVTYDDSATSASKKILIFNHNMKNKKMPQLPKEEILMTKTCLEEKANKNGRNCHSSRIPHIFVDLPL
jgi:hypothetical protein